MSLPYWIVDAFTQHLFAGNPAAVILCDAMPEAALMQSVAAENNLAETAFAAPEGDGYRLRWFTPTVEVDLCGHATLATAFVLSLQGQAGPFRFSTRSGVLGAAVTEGRITLDFPARQFAPIEAPTGLLEVLGTEPLAVLQSADLIAVLASPGAIRDLSPVSSSIRALPGGALIITAEGGDDADITSRYFAPGYGIDEDPVTGSLHTQVVPYWAGKLGRPRLRCHQASARGGDMVCTHQGGRVLLEGTAILYARGEIFL